MQHEISLRLLRPLFVHERALEERKKKEAGGQRYRAKGRSAEAPAQEVLNRAMQTWTDMSIRRPVPLFAGKDGIEPLTPAFSAPLSNGAKWSGISGYY
jgi:hypothetical protein